MRVFPTTDGIQSGYICWGALFYTMNHIIGEGKIHQKNTCCVKVPLVTLNVTEDVMTWESSKSLPNLRASYFFLPPSIHSRFVFFTFLSTFGLFLAYNQFAGIFHSSENIILNTSDVHSRFNMFALNVEQRRVNVKHVWFFANDGILQQQKPSPSNRFNCLADFFLSILFDFVLACDFSLHRTQIINRI